MAGLLQCSEGEVQPGAQAAVQERPSVSFQDDGDADGGNVADHGSDDGAGTIILQTIFAQNPVQGCAATCPPAGLPTGSHSPGKKISFFELGKLMENLNFCSFFMI